jgi:hypothetical protein
METMRFSVGKPISSYWETNGLPEISISLALK